MLKLVSWNVNGFNSILKQNFKEIIYSKMQSDIICLQETKVQKKNVDYELINYYSYWSFAENKSFSGTAVFTKIKPLNVSYGIESEDYDYEGRVITLEFNDFYLINCYTPNSLSSRKRLNYRQIWDIKFKEYVEKMNNKKNIILCGDFNIAHRNIDITKEFRNNWKINEEQKSFSELLKIGLIDTYRYFHPQMQKFSWFFQNDTNTKNGRRLDYFLISEELKKDIRLADIRNDIKGSDHSPIELYLELN